MAGRNTTRTGRIAAVSVAVLGMLLLADCSSDEPPPPPSITDSPPIAVGIVNDLPGFSSGDVTNPAGFDIDVMRAIGKELKTAVAITPIKSKDRDIALQQRTATLVIAAYSITTTRKQAGIDFAGPYMTSTQAFLVPVDRKGVPSNTDLAAMQKCSVNGTTGGDVILPGQEKTTETDTLLECFNLLDAGTVDTIFDDTLVLYGWAQQFASQPGHPQYRVVLPGAFGTNQYYGVGLLGGQHADCLKINDAIRSYLDTQWRTDFRATLPLVVETFTGQSGSLDNYESEFKPTSKDLARLACT